jgi:hypothetical protein
MAEAKAVECPICCEVYNKSTRKEVCCEYADCNYSCCKACVRQYLLSSTMDPHCMNCKKAWGQRFLVMNLNKVFMVKDYLAHRKQLLLEKEIAKLPDTMELAAKTAEILKLNKQSVDIYKQIKLLTSEIVKNSKLPHDERTLTMDDIIKKSNDVYLLRRTRDNINNKIFELRDQKDPTEKRKFIMGCANPDCRGFLSTSYKCELCKMYTCSDCLEFIGDNKSEHVCNEDNVKSAETIKKETKPCPKCGERIYKIDGCDQMWCCQCHTTFDWVSGKIDNGVIHNPHFFEYHRKLREKGQVNPNAFGECNPMNVPDWYIFYNSVLYPLDLIDSHMNDCLVGIYRFVTHITQVELTDVRNKMNETQNTSEIRVDYILKRIDKKTMASRIAQKDKSRQKLAEIFNIYELISNVGRELLHGLTNLHSENSLALEATVVQQTNNFDNLILYCNEQFAIIGASYGGNVPNIMMDPYNFNWEIKKKEYGLSKLFEKSQGAGAGSSEIPIQ